MNTMETFVFASISGKNGRMLASSQYIAFGVCGVAVAELIDMGRMKLDGKHVLLTSTASTGNLILDEVCAFVEKKKSRYRLDALITSLPYYVKRMMKRLTENLEDNGCIRIEQHRFLGLIPYNRYVVSRVAQHQKLVKELKEVTLNAEKGTDAAKAFLIALLYECGAYKRFFSKDECKLIKESFKLIRKGAYFDHLDETGIKIQKTVRNAIAASQAASS